MPKYDVVMPYVGSFVVRGVEAEDDDAAVEKAARELPSLEAHMRTYRDDVVTKAHLDKLGEDADVDTEDSGDWDKDNAEVTAQEEEEEE